MGLTKYKLKQLISRCIGGNEDLSFDTSSLKGISVNKIFFSSKADMENESLGNYTVVNPKCFSFVTVTSRNGNKISIAYNDSEETFIVSSFYVTFKLNDFAKSVLLEEYLFLYFNRTEFDRYARQDSWGSAREYFYFENMCDVEIDLPPLSVQQKYVDIYNAMVANQKCYERGLEDLKLTCDAYIEKLRRESHCEMIGPYITKTSKNNNEEIEKVLGIGQSGFISPQKDPNASLKNYKILENNSICYAPPLYNIKSDAIHLYTDTGRAYLQVHTHRLIE